MDESGDHGLTTIVPEFPVFLLCGVLVAQNDYETIKASMNAIKAEHWADKKVISVKIKGQTRSLASHRSGTPRSKYYFARFT